MRYSMTLALACLLGGAGILSAQQPNSFGPPSVAGGAAPLPPSAAAQAAPFVGPPPRPDPVQTPALSGPALGPTPAPGGPLAPLPPGYVPSGAVQFPYPPPPGAYAPLAYPGSLLSSSTPNNPTLWVGVEALLWWTKGQPLGIPVITTGPASQGAMPATSSAPGTTSLNGSLHYGPTGGMRIFGGAWLDAGHTYGLDASVFFLGRQSSSFGATDRSGNGNFVINEPLYGAPFSTQVSAPGTDTGAVSVRSSSRLAGGDVNGLFNIYRANGWTVNLIGGYRYLQLDESLEIAATSRMFVTTTYDDNMGNVLVSAPPGSTINVSDRFGTRNQFNGGQLGATFQYAWERWSLSGAVKVGIGATHEMISIDGNTTVYPTNANPVPLSGGNFATLQTGTYSQNRFAVAPEAQLNVGYQITPWMRATFGYNFLYLSSVARPGNQIDNSFDGVVHPIVPMANSSYWAQGLNFGLQFRF